MQPIVQPLDVWFWVGFSGSADRTVPLPVGPIPRQRPATILKISNVHICSTVHGGIDDSIMR